MTHQGCEAKSQLSQQPTSLSCSVPRGRGQLELVQRKCCWPGVAGRGQAWPGVACLCPDVEGSGWLGPSAPWLVGRMRGAGSGGTNGPALWGPSLLEAWVTVNTNSGFFRIPRARKSCSQKLRGLILGKKSIKFKNVFSI